MYTVKKKFTFCASHSLRNLPVGHPCTRLHGHNYEVEMEFKSQELNQTGFVLDYREMEVIKNHLDSRYDHQDLNTVMDWNPTAENIARELYTEFKRQFQSLFAVTVSETPKTSARYEPQHIG